MASNSTRPPRIAPDHPVPVRWSRLAFSLSLLMVAYGVAWEAVIDPIRDGSLLWLKVLPILPLLPGLLQGRVKRHQAMSLLIWVYLCEALVRVASPQATEAWLAAGWLVLGLGVFASVAIGSRASRMAARVSAGDSPSESALRQ